MLKAVTALLLLTTFVFDAEAGKHRKHPPKHHEPEVSVGGECDLMKEVATHQGELKRIAAGARVKVTDVHKDELGISTAAGTASVKRRDLLAACDKAPQ